MRSGVESSGDVTRRVVPPCPGAFGFSTTCPAALHCTRSLASAGRVMKQCSALQSSAPQ